MIVATTARLVLRELVPDDASFLLELMTEPAFLRWIGDRGVHNEAAARAFIARRWLAHYAEHGFGHWLASPRDGGAPLGLAGLVRRDGLEHPDIGYAFVERAWGRGYAFEAASAVRDLARDRFGLERLQAIVLPDHVASIRLLTRLGFAYERTTRLPGEDVDLAVYGRGLGPATPAPGSP